VVRDWPIKCCKLAARPKIRDLSASTRQLLLNRVEARHSLARWLFFARRGEFRDGDLNENHEQDQLPESARQCRGRME
jgi:TnpA family transposase